MATNLMTQIYIGYVKEIIYDSTCMPTMALRIRVPTVHGVDSKSGLPDEDLPIAEPLIIPGIAYNKDNIEDILRNINKVYVIFEGGNYNNPVYFGIKGNSSLYKLKSNNTFIQNFNDIAEFPPYGSTSILYRVLSTNVLYYWDQTTVAYLPLYEAGPGSVASGIHIGPEPPTDPNIEIWWQTGEVEFLEYPNDNPDISYVYGIEFQTTLTHIQWRYTGEETWKDLIPISELKGDTGIDAKNIELRSNTTHIQWNYVGEDNWTDLVSLSELTGPPGESANADIDVEQIRESFILALRKSYKEVYKTEGKVTLVEIWEDNTKLNHLFTKSITYDLEGRVSEVITTDYTTSNVLTKTIAYIDSNVMSINEIITSI